MQLETKARCDDAAAMAGVDLPLRDNLMYVAGKRAFDLAVGIFASALVLPIVPIIALMIKLDSPGPVFYRQDRIGRGGRPFRFYKFRSMYREADRRRAELQHRNEQDGPVFKIKADPRITPVGQFLRRSSVDEIPQIINVLRGEMSVVGPRPALPAEVARYQPWHRRRLDVKPGITCLWQIAGRSQIGFDEWMRLDMEYLRTRGLRTDLTIFAKTLPAVMARRGAY
ncbi:MAG TPA: sugar transferase [Candidatus Krumholzibacteria bacterium]|nr:sugar transferase [Candidatus Krumholzibacteria bacterium]